MIDPHEDRSTTNQGTEDHEMETAKVDIRKLQLLNDRINQCLEALQQVRYSVHGLSHSTGAQGGAGYPGGLGGTLGGFGQQQNFMTNPMQSQGVVNPFGGSQYGSPVWGGQNPIQSFGQGFSHTGGINPWTVNPALAQQYSQVLGQQYGPQHQSQFGVGFGQQSPFTNPQQLYGQGLSHTGIGVSPWQQQPWLQQLYPQVGGFNSGLTGDLQGYSGNPFMNQGIEQAFPFAQSPVPGVFSGI